MADSWVDMLTVNEVEQVKLIYMTIYEALGLTLDEHCTQLEAASSHRRQNCHSSSTARSLGRTRDSRRLSETSSNPSKSSFEYDSLEYTLPPSPNPSSEVSYSKRFPPLSKLFRAAKKQFKNHKRETLIDHFRLLTRDNSDKLIARYIKQNRDSMKAVVHLAKTIVWHSETCDVRQIMRDGEWSHINPREENHLKELELGRFAWVGRDKQNRPVAVIKGKAQKIGAHSKDYDLRTFTKIYEEITLFSNDQEEGNTFIFDCTDLKLENFDLRAIHLIISHANVLYPNSAAQVMIHKAPRFLERSWKFILPLIDPYIASRIRFTRKTSDLLSQISIEQLPAHLGGCSRHEYKWSPPNKDDDIPLSHVVRRRELLKQRQELLLSLEQLTYQWIKELNPQHAEFLQSQRKSLLAQCARNYWELDPYIRSRSLFDRNGIAGFLRPELQPRAIAQPYCKVAEPFPRRISPTQTMSQTASILRAHDTEDDSLSFINTPQFRRHFALVPSS